MQSPQIRKVFDRYADLFQILYKQPFEWDKKRQKLRHTSNWRQLKYWLLNMVVLQSLYGAATLYDLLRAFYIKDDFISLFVSAVHLIDLFVLAFGVSLGFLFLFFGERMIYIWETAMSVTQNFATGKQIVIFVDVIDFL